MSAKSSVVMFMPNEISSACAPRNRAASSFARARIASTACPVAYGAPRLPDASRSAFAIACADLVRHLRPAGRVEEREPVLERREARSAPRPRSRRLSVQDPRQHGQVDVPSRDHAHHLSSNVVVRGPRRAPAPPLPPESPASARPSAGRRPPRRRATARTRRRAAATRAPRRAGSARGCPSRRRTTAGTRRRSACRRRRTSPRPGAPVAGSDE